MNLRPGDAGRRGTQPTTGPSAGSAMTAPGATFERFADAIKNVNNRYVDELNKHFSINLSQNSTRKIH